MNGYDLSRNFWNWAFDNPEKISPNHAAIYFFAVEHCNRLGGKEKFGFPSQMTMDAIGIKKHSTYIRYFNDLVEFGFFKLLEKSKNQYSANIISLTNAMPKKGKALDKAFMNHAAKQTESNGQSKRSIDKQLNNRTTKQLNTNFDEIDLEPLFMKLSIDPLLMEKYKTEFTLKLHLDPECKTKTTNEIFNWFVNWLKLQPKRNFKYLTDQEKERKGVPKEWTYIYYEDTYKRLQEDDNGNFVQIGREKIRV
jgi:hypothetical protein